MDFFRPNTDIRKQRKILKKELRLPYKLKVTNTRVYLSSSLGSYMTDDKKIPMGELNYIKQVKAFIVKNKLYEGIPKIKEDRISYMRYSSKLRPGFEAADCYEIDMRGAYWEMLRRSNLLDPVLYEKSMKTNPETGEPYISKPTKLACAGSLAGNARVYEFDGKEETMRRENNKLTEHIWNHIAYQVSKIMKEAQRAAGADFLMFWVDAVFVRSKKGRAAVIRVLRKHKYEFSEIDIKSLEVKDKKVHVTKAKKNAKKKFRTFPFAPHKQR